MKRVVLATLLLMSTSGLLLAQTPTQPKPSEVVFTKDAGEVFASLVLQVQIGMMFMNTGDLRDHFMRGLELTKTKTGDPTMLGSSDGTWLGENASGFVWIKVSSSGPLDKTHDQGVVTFVPHSEQPIPQALLTHLLATGERTKISGADTLDLEFAFENLLPQSPCTSQRTLTIRIGTGAMVSNSVTGYCDVLKK
jgi:hypothetical protein